MKCKLETGLPSKDIMALLKTELSRQHPRSKVTLGDERGSATITITAEDTTAMRAALNGVTSVIGIYEKTHGTH